MKTFIVAMIALLSFAGCAKSSEEEAVPQQGTGFNDLVMDDEFVMYTNGELAEITWADGSDYEREFICRDYHNYGIQFSRDQWIQSAYEMGYPLSVTNAMMFVIRREC